MILGQALRLALAGIVAGIGIALAVTRLLASMLYGTAAADPLTFLGVALLFVVVALAAGFMPAWRAMRVDPAEALR
jgi:putative ABC transport system permease protein